MERRGNIRVNTNLRVMALLDGCRYACTAIELSTDGMVLKKSAVLCERSVSDINVYEVSFDHSEPIRIRAKTVWSRDALQGVHFVAMNDVDRITIAEELDKAVAA